MRTIPMLNNVCGKLRFPRVSKFKLRDYLNACEKLTSPQSTVVGLKDIKSRCSVETHKCSFQHPQSHDSRISICGLEKQYLGRVVDVIYSRQQRVHYCTHTTHHTHSRIPIRHFHVSKNLTFHGTPAALKDGPPGKLNYYISLVAFGYTFYEL